MSTLLQVFNENGDLQVDTTQYVMRLIKSQTITLQKSFWGNANAKTTVTVTGQMPMIFFADAIGASGYAHNRYRVDRMTSVGTGDVRQWTFHLNISGDALPSITSYTFRIYIFDASPQISGTFGLETYDENEKLTFSSFTAPMKVLASYQIQEYIFAYQYNCEIFQPVPGIVLDNTAMSSSWYRDGFYASETTTFYLDVAQEYMSFDNLLYPPNEAVTGVSYGLYQTGETLNDFGAQPGANSFSYGIPRVTLIDTTMLPMPFQ